ncbi:hypothetical protein [Mycoplasma sp. Z1473D]
MLITVKQINEYKNGILKKDFKDFCNTSNLFLYKDFEAIVDEDLKSNGLYSEYLFYFDYLSFYCKMKINDFLWVDIFIPRIDLFDEYQVVKIFINSIGGANWET